MITVSDYGGKPYEPIPLPQVVGTQYTEVMRCPLCRDLQIQLTTTGMVVGESYAVIIEGSLDNSGFDNLSVIDAITTITVDRTTILESAGVVTPYVRIYIVPTLAAGSIAAIDAQATFGVIS